MIAPAMAPSMLRADPADAAEPQIGGADQIGADDRAERGRRDVQRMQPPRFRRHAGRRRGTSR